MNYPEKKFVSNAAEGLERKQQYIKDSQRSTQDSIRVSGSATDATLIVAALIQAKFYDPNEEDLRKHWEKWRKYFFEKRDIGKTFVENEQAF